MLHHISFPSYHNAWTFFQLNLFNSRLTLHTCIHEYSFFFYMSVLMEFHQHCSTGLNDKCIRRKKVFVTNTKPFMFNFTSALSGWAISFLNQHVLFLGEENKKEKVLMHMKILNVDLVKFHQYLILSFNSSYWYLDVVIWVCTLSYVDTYV